MQPTNTGDQLSEEKNRGTTRATGETKHPQAMGQGVIAPVAAHIAKFFLQYVPEQFFAVSGFFYIHAWFSPVTVDVGFRPEPKVVYAMQVCNRVHSILVLTGGGAVIFWLFSLPCLQAPPLLWQAGHLRCTAGGTPLQAPNERVAYSRLEFAGITSCTVE